MSEEEEIAEVRRKWGEIRRTEEVLLEWEDSPLVRWALWVVKGLKRRGKMKEEEKRRNMENAKAKYKEAWWESDDPKVLFLGQIQEDILLMDFDKFHKATEQALERPVWTHEFVEPEELLGEYYSERPKAPMEEVLDKIRRYKKPIIVMGVN